LFVVIIIGVYAAADISLSLLVSWPSVCVICMTVTAYILGSIVE